MACSVLAACSSRSLSLVQTATQSFRSPPDPSNTPLNPALRYMRIVADGRIALLVLGYTDQDKLGLVETWYSGEGEVLRLQNGHVVGLTGTSDEWRQTRLSAMPAWPAVGTVATFTRVRDTMPNYRFNITDTMSMRQTLPPAKSNLQGVNPADLRWFELTDSDAHLPLARIALAPDNTAAGGTPIYGEQCISQNLCVSWQQWPPVQKP